MSVTAVIARSDPQRTPRALRLLRDDRLSARAHAGDREAFAELYRRYHQRIYRYALSLLRTPDDAADTLQATMAKALTALEDEAPIERVRPWLFRIAHNEAISLLRMRRPQVDLENLTLEETPSSPDAPSEAARRADLTQLVTDVHGLPDRQQSALVMRELSDLSYDEIAVALGTSALASRQLVHQARSALHDQARGRAMKCETVREAIGDAEGRTPRNRRLKAHLGDCDDCRGFQRGLQARGSGLAAFAPPLAPAAASEILRRLLEGASGHGAAVVTGGGLAAGGIAKVAGASTAKLAAAAAAAVVAAGGAVIVGERIVSGPADHPEQGTLDAGQALRPGVPPLPSFDEIARKRRQQVEARRSERGPVRKQRLSVADATAVPTPIPVALASPDAEVGPAAPAQADTTPAASTREETRPTQRPRGGSHVERPRSDSGTEPTRETLPHLDLSRLDRLPDAPTPTVATPTVDPPAVDVPAVDPPANLPTVTTPDVPPNPPVDIPPAAPPSAPSLPRTAPDTGGSLPSG